VHWTANRSTKDLSNEFGQDSDIDIFDHIDPVSDILGLI
jgi:hypothetical protein